MSTQPSMGMKLRLQAPLLLRTDAGFDIGTGHVMRLLALVEAWQEAQPPAAEPALTILLGCVPMPGLRKRLADAGVGVWDLMASHPDPGDLAALANLAAVFQPGWIVLDGYHFDPDYQAAVRALGIPVLVVDDIAQHSHYHASLLLNQNLGAKGLHYAVDSDTRLLLEARYCLLRSELKRARNTPRAPSPSALEHRSLCLLITMGGSDPRGLTLLALEAVAAVGADWEVLVVVRSTTPQLNALRQFAATLPNIALHEDVQDMGVLMNSADFALSASGTTAWELAALGVPALLVTVADNQIPIADVTAAVGFSINLGWWETLTVANLATALKSLAADDAQRARMRTAGQAVVDGEGAARVVQAMYEYQQLSSANESRHE